MTYGEKLKDPRWQRRRLQILEQWNFCCRYCGNFEKTLHVHHHFYRRGVEPWEYSDNELSCLCADCHRDATVIQDRIRAALARRSPIEAPGILAELEVREALDLFAGGHKRISFPPCNLPDWEGSVMGLLGDGYRFEKVGDQLIAEELRP